MCGHKPFGSIYNIYNISISAVVELGENAQQLNYSKLRI